MAEKGDYYPKMSTLSVQEILKLAKARRKFPVGADFDKNRVFDFSFLHDSETVDYIQEHGKVMFLIRGAPSTGKATLSDMFIDRYDTGTHCCADAYFPDNSTERNKYSLKESHNYCQKKAKDACENNTSVVIVQNTHMRKWEMQYYINLAAKHTYTVIMAITLYRFDVTPKALLAISNDGLNIQYFQRRLQHWEDIPPLLTGWFLGPKDTAHVQALTLESVKKLVGDGRFCRVFGVNNPVEIAEYFQARKLLCCLAGYTWDCYEMKKYYLSQIVQYLYGKSFKITILGYLVTPTRINAIVHINKMMQLLMLDNMDESGHTYLSDLTLSDNMAEHTATHSYEEYEKPSRSTVTFEEWEEKEDILASDCTFIPLARKGGLEANTGINRKEFKQALKEAADEEGKIGYDSFSELESGVRVCRLQSKEWLVKAPKKIIVSTVFSGLYV